MGNSFAISLRHSRARTTTRRDHQQQEVVQVVKMDGKILELRASILVKDLLLKFPGLSVAASKKNPESLPLSYELKLGNIYYLLPSLLSHVQKEEQSPSCASSNSSVMIKKTIRVVVTKKQLQDLLSKRISLDSVVSSEINTDSESCIDSSKGWKPRLEIIPEGI